jgi:hypothetical protein
VSSKQVRAFFGRDQHILTLFKFVLRGLGLVLAVLALLWLLGRSTAASNQALNIGVPLFCLVYIANMLFIWRVGITVQRYQCARCRYGWVALQGRPEVVQTIGRKTEADLARRQRSGNQAAIAEALMIIGSAALSQGDPTRGAQLLEQSLALARANGHTLAIAGSLNDLGMLALFRGGPEQARAQLEESASLTHELGNWQLIAMPLNNLALAVLDCGDDQRAVQLLAESLPLHQKLHLAEGIAWGLAGVAEVMAVRREMVHAATLWAAAQAQSADVGIPFIAQMQQRQQHSNTIARTSLGESEFAAAWTKGSLLSQDEAIAYALERMRPASGAA